MNWDMVSKSKTIGGLRVIDLKVFNQTLIDKHIRIG
jgi:hypothetical protein